MGGQDQGKQDKAKSLASAPKGFDAKRDGIERGKLETVEYESTVSGGQRKGRLHAAGLLQGQEVSRPLSCCTASAATRTSGPRGGVPNVILDNLYADKKAVPMIVVMPNGRASKDVTAGAVPTAVLGEFATFEKDLLGD